MKYNLKKKKKSREIHLETKCKIRRVRRKQGIKTTKNEERKLYV